MAVVARPWFADDWDACMAGYVSVSWIVVVVWSGSEKPATSASKFHGRYGSPG